MKSMFKNDMHTCRIQPLVYITFAGDAGAAPAVWALQDNLKNRRHDHEERSLIRLSLPFRKDVEMTNLLGHVFGDTIVLTDTLHPAFDTAIHVQGGGLFLLKASTTLLPTMLSIARKGISTAQHYIFNTAKHCIQVLFRQARIFYGPRVTMPDIRLIPLLKQFFESTQQSRTIAPVITT